MVGGFFQAGERADFYLVGGGGETPPSFSHPPRWWNPTMWHKHGWLDWLWQFLGERWSSFNRMTFISNDFTQIVNFPTWICDCYCHSSARLSFLKIILKIASHFTNWNIYKLQREIKTFTIGQYKRQYLTAFLWRK